MECHEKDTPLSLRDISPEGENILVTTLRMKL
jgi:hypothetical protein